MSFSFSFSGDDIEEDDNGHDEAGQSKSSQPTALPASNGNQTAVQVQSHNLKDLLSNLPGNISYSTTHLTSPQAGQHALVPRRALFDVRMQLMDEDDSTGERPAPGSDAKTAVQDMLDGNSDITRNVYEGGFKSWEGAHDLALLLLDRQNSNEIAELDAIIELGCGQAVPALVLFQQALRRDKRPHMVLADYNADVLRLLTLPNLLLTWAMQSAPQALDPAPPTLDAEGRLMNGDGDLDVTPQLLADFQQDLERRGIAISLLSGPWSPELTTHMTAELPAESSVLILGAETIYSPESLDAFSDTLIGVISRARTGKAYVAAKRVYFGVGGGVDVFKNSFAGRGGIATELSGTGIEACERGVSGVGRCLLEAQIA